MFLYRLTTSDRPKYMNFQGVTHRKLYLILSKFGVKSISKLHVEGNIIELQ